MIKNFGFTPPEARILRQLSTPARIQDFLENEVGYNKEKDGETCRSPRRVLRDRLAHCMEGALLAAAALRFHGHPPLLVDLVSAKGKDTDHILAVYRRDGLWGAVAKSNFTGLRFREPVYRSLRELVMSYFEDYFNEEGYKSLRAFSRPVDLARFDRIDWMTTETDLFAIGEYLWTIDHTQVIGPSDARRLRPVDPLLLRAGMLGGAK